MPHMGYQMVTWPMTSRDPERCYKAVRSAILATATCQFLAHDAKHCTVTSRRVSCSCLDTNIQTDRQTQTHNWPYKQTTQHSSTMSEFTTRVTSQLHRGHAACIAVAEVIWREGGVGDTSWLIHRSSAINRCSASVMGTIKDCGFVFDR